MKMRMKPKSHEYPKWDVEGWDQYMRRKNIFDEFDVLEDKDSLDGRVEE